jgi:hypothetical protein
MSDIELKMKKNFSKNFSEKPLYTFITSKLD